MKPPASNHDAGGFAVVRARSSGRGPQGENRRREDDPRWGEEARGAARFVKQGLLSARSSTSLSVSTALELSPQQARAAPRGATALPHPTCEVTSCHVLPSSSPALPSACRFSPLAPLPGRPAPFTALPPPSLTATMPLLQLQSRQRCSHPRPAPRKATTVKDWSSTWLFTPSKRNCFPPSSGWRFPIPLQVLPGLWPLLG